jgi:DNA-binding CsgD family transcriptional regulator
MIERCPDQETVFQVLRDYGASFGFSHATIGQCVSPNLRNMKYADLGASNFPKEFQQIYISNNYILHDAIVQKALYSMDAFSWADAEAVASTRGKDIFLLGRDFSLNAGFTVPFHMDSYAPGIVSFAADRYGMSPTERSALELICMHGYSRLVDLAENRTAPDRVNLTPREIDVLHHVAGGKQDDEIADALSIGTYSVKRHLSNARRKLGAANRAHSVTIAIRDGYILL